MLKFSLLLQVCLLLVLSQSMLNLPFNVALIGSATNNSNNQPQPNTSTQIVKLSDQNTPILATDSINNSLPWQELGPLPLENTNNAVTWGTGPYSGRVTAIAVNESNSQEIYVGTAQGGVWKSLDGGVDWTPLMDQQISLAIGSITIAPDNHTLYVGTGEANHGGDNYAGIGLLKSTNEGKIWTILGSTYFADSSISSIVVTKSNPNNILVSTTYATYAKGYTLSQNSNGLGIFLSTNGGSTWTETQTGGNEGFAEMVVNTSNDNIIYASDYSGYVWRSLNAGASWAKYIGYSSSADQGRVAIAVTPANSSLLYIIFTNSSGEEIFIAEYDGPTNYNQLNDFPAPNNYQYGPCSGQCWFDLTINVDPTNVKTVYVGTNNLYKTTDAGSTWSFLGGAEQNGNLHPDMHAFAFDPSNPQTIYSGNDGGIYKSTNAGSTWSSLNANLGVIQFVSISASPSSDTHIIGGVQDNACDIYTNSTSWTIGDSGDGAATAFFSDTAFVCNYVYLSYRYTTNNGISFYTLNNGLNLNDPSEFYAPMAQDPNTPTTLYLASNRVYKLTSGASSWTDISSQISTGIITSITVAKTNSRVLYEGDDLGIVKVSTNGGTSWSQIFDTSVDSSALKSIPITSVAVNPFNSSIVYISLATKTNIRMYYSLDQGSTWSSEALTGVPSVAVTVVKINPISGTPFIGTDRGMYYQNKTGEWNQIGFGLPNAAVFDFTFTKSNYLVVGTHGRGAWLNYITPFVLLSSPAGSYQSKKNLSVTISDPNGFSNATYHWDSSDNTTTSANFNVTIPTTEGLHTLYVYAMDPTGNWVNKTIVFRTDNTSPIITLASATNNTQINGGATVQLQISDLSPIQSVLYNWNTSSNSTETLVSGKISIIAPTKVGQAVLYVYAEDSAGNWANETYTFTITTPPTTSGQISTTRNTSGQSSSTTPGFELLVIMVSQGVIVIRKKYKDS